VRELRLVVALLLGAVTAAPAQLAVSQPTTKLLILPFEAAPADSATSIMVADAVRERLGQIAKYKMVVIPKKQLCDVLAQSGFSCDGLLDDQQAQQLARHLQVHAYSIGTLEHHSTTLSVHVRVLDIGSSGMASNFVVTNGNPGTPQALAEAIAQRINAVIKASEHTRECTQNRMRSQYARALAAAQKALETEPTSTGAHLCIASVYEAQRMPIDSQIAASTRALAGDSLNATAWENIARAYQQKGDTLKAIDAFIHQLRGEPRNNQKRLAIAQLLRQMKRYQPAVDLLDEGLAVTPGEPQLTDFKTRICIEGSLYACAIRGLLDQLQRDSTLARDSAFLKTGIGAAQQRPDTQALLTFTAAAARHFPNDVSFLKARGAAFELAGMPDSAVTTYKLVVARAPNDVPAALLVAKAIVDAAVWDTAAANRLKGDTAGLARARSAFADRIDGAKPYLRPGLAASDSSQRLTAAVIMLSGGQKIAQAAAYDRAYPWLDTLLQVVAPRAPGDSVGPRFQVRVNASFWWGLSSVLTLRDPFQAMTKSKSCEAAKAINDRLVRTRAALTLGRRVHPPTADQMLGFVAQYEAPMPQVKKAFKCRNF
jgi:tetratricopeptide (TPR) repeat protein